VRNEQWWRPSKYVERGGRHVPTRDRAELAPSSVLVAALVAERYAAAIPVHARGTLLDLGCGKQPLYAMYRHRVDRVLAADWPASLHASAQIDVFCDLAAPLPFADASADTVLLSDVLEHLPRPDLAFAEIARTMAPGAHLIMNTPFLYRIHEAPHDFHRHTRFSLERLAATSGLEVVALQELGGALDVTVDLAGKLVEQVPVVGGLLAAGLQRTAVRLGSSRLWRTIRRLTAPTFPLGYFMVARKPPDVLSPAGPPEPS
jgi:SAM-dependent methyltransferase